MTDGDGVLMMDIFMSLPVLTGDLEELQHTGLTSIAAPTNVASATISTVAGGVGPGVPSLPGEVEPEPAPEGSPSPEPKAAPSPPEEDEAAKLARENQELKSAFEGQQRILEALEAQQ